MSATTTRFGSGQQGDRIDLAGTLVAAETDAQRLRAFYVSMLRIRLFEERARSAHPTFVLTDQNANIDSLLAAANKQVQALIDKP